MTITNKIGAMLCAKERDALRGGNHGRLSALSRRNVPTFESRVISGPFRDDAYTCKGQTRSIGAGYWLRYCALASRCGLNAGLSPARREFAAFARNRTLTHAIQIA